MYSLLQSNIWNPVQQCVTCSKSVPQTRQAPCLSLPKSTEARKGLTLPRAPRLWRWLGMSPTASSSVTLETYHWTITAFYTSYLTVLASTSFRPLQGTNFNQSWTSGSFKTGRKSEEGDVQSSYGGLSEGWEGSSRMDLTAEIRKGEDNKERGQGQRSPKRCHYVPKKLLKSGSWEGRWS